MEEKILKLFKNCASKVSGAIEKKGLQKGRYMGEGADGTPTKGIDEAAERVAIDYLTEKTDYSILSEEKGIVEGDGEGYVIIDPIDGTRNALLDLPFYCISLAYTPKALSEVEVGYVKNLATGTEYHAIKGEGSFKDNSRLDPTSDGNNIYSVYLGDKARPESFEVSKEARRVRVLGSAALEICMVADGTFDLHYHRTPEEKESLRITDIAAGTLILREVGGEVYDKNLDKLEMRPDPKERKDIICIYDDEIKEELT